MDEDGSDSTIAGVRMQAVGCIGERGSPRSSRLKLCGREKRAPAVRGLLKGTRTAVANVSSTTSSSKSAASSAAGGSSACDADDDGQSCHDSILRDVVEFAASSKSINRRRARAAPRWRTSAVVPVVRCIAAECGRR